MTRNRLVYAWILLGCSALLLSGVLAMSIMAGKLPFLKTLINLEWIRWSLVIHVNLANLVWFTSIPLALLHLSSRDPTKPVPVSAVFGLGLSIAGIVMFITSFPREGVNVVLSNYIPVVTHPRFQLGLGLYCVGVGVNYLSRETLLPWNSIDESRFGIWLGGLFFIAAVLSVLFNVIYYNDADFISQKLFYEIIFWGGGHLLQHSSSVFLIVAWIATLSSELQKPAFSRASLFFCFRMGGIAAPFCSYYSFFSNYKS